MLYSNIEYKVCLYLLFYFRGDVIMKKFTAKHTRICKLCGEEFLPITRNQQYCKKQHTKICAICGKSFTIDKSNYRRNCCSKECINKLRECTNIERFGVPNAAMSDEVKEKERNIFLMRYGVTTPFYMDGFRKKYKSTCIDRYGVEHPLRSPEVQAKRRATCLSKFGDEEPLRLPHAKSALFEKYSDDTWKSEVFSKRLKSGRCVASDGKIFDSKYEVIIYEFCIRNKLDVSTQIPISFEYDGNIHQTYIDFRINGRLFECKGGHLLGGCFDHSSSVPISEKIKLYNANNVVIITDWYGRDLYDKHINFGESDVFNQSVAIDIDLFDNLNSGNLNILNELDLFDLIVRLTTNMRGYISNDIILSQL